MANNPTVSDLSKRADITADEIAAAVDAVLADLATPVYPVAKGWTLDLVAVLRANPRVAEALKSDQAQWKRGIVRAAILRAHPVEG